MSDKGALIFNFIASTLLLLIIGEMIVSDVQILASNDGKEYAEIIGKATNTTPYDVKVEYIVDSKEYSGTLQIEGYSSIEPCFIKFYYNVKDPTQITIKNNANVSWTTVIACTILMIIVISYICCYIYTRRLLKGKDTYKKELELLGHDNVSLVYIDKEGKDGIPQIYYAKGFYTLKTYQELVANKCTSAELIVYSKNEKLWRVDTSKALEVLYGKN